MSRSLQRKSVVLQRLRGSLNAVEALVRLHSLVAVIGEMLPDVLWCEQFGKACWFVTCA